MTGITDRGVISYACDDLKVESNFIDGGCATYGIQISQNTVNSVQYDPQRNLIAGNTVKGVTGIGIYVSNGKDHHIDGNHVYDCQNVAIQTTSGCSNSKVDDNVIRGASVGNSGVYAAIRVASEAVTASNNDIGPGSSGASAYTYGCYAATGSLRSNFNGNKVVKGTSGVISQASQALLTALNRRVLLYTSDGITTGNASLSDSLDNYRRTEVLIGNAGSNNMSTGSVAPFAEDGSWTYGSENFNVPGIGSDLTAVVTNSTTITLSSTVAILRKIYGIREVH